MDASVLLELERAELAARARRLSAEAEAERLLAAARAEALRVEAGTEQAIAAALDARRAELQAAADRTIAAIEAQLPDVGGDQPSGNPAGHPGFQRAVQLVERAVLGQPMEREA